MASRQGELKHEDDQRSRPFDSDWEKLKSHYENASPAEIEADIRRTRAEMDLTLEELQHRLNPRNLWHDVVDLFRSRKHKSGSTEAHEAHHDGGAGETAGNIGWRVFQVVRDHPVSAVLVTTAVATLIYENAARHKSKSSSIRSINIYRGAPTMYGESHAHDPSEKPYSAAGEHISKKRFDFPEQQAGSSVGEKISHAGESVRSGIQHTGEAISSGAHHVRESASHLGDQMRHGMERTREFIEERPLTVGVGALALGLLVGLLIPRTHREDRLMGEQSERFIERSKDIGEDVLERSEHVAEEAIDAAVEAASTESEKQGLKPE